MMVKPFIVWSSSIDSKSTDSYLIDIIETLILHDDKETLCASSLPGESQVLVGSLILRQDTSLQIQEYAEFDVFWTRMRNAKGPIHPASAIQKQPSVALEQMKSSSSRIQPMKKKVEEP